METLINSNKNLLAVCAIGTESPDIFGKITHSFVKCGCEILESKFSIMGNKFLLMAMVSGSWDSIAKIETALKRLGQNLGLTFSVERITENSTKNEDIPYVMEVVAAKNIDLVHQAVRFFELQKVIIKELLSGGFVANHTKAQMISLQITISVPPELSISSFRSDFVDFCDRLNIDAVLEPLK